MTRGNPAKGRDGNDELATPAGATDDGSPERMAEWCERVEGPHLNLRELPMTDDEERQRLCVWLRILSRHPAVLQAADEIERLAALVQSDAKPVAWRWKWRDSGLWFATENKFYADVMRERGAEVEPLYTAPPNKIRWVEAQPFVIKDEE